MFPAPRTPFGRRSFGVSPAIRGKALNNAIGITQGIEADAGGQRVELRIAVRTRVASDGLRRVPYPVTGNPRLLFITLAGHMSS